MFNEGETVLSLRTKATVLCFEWLTRRWGRHCEPSCYLGDGSAWVVGFVLFFFLMGTGELFGQLGIGYGKNIAYSFTVEHGFYTS